MNMCSVAPVTREMQIKMTMWDHYTTTRQVKPTLQPPDDQEASDSANGWRRWLINGGTSRILIMVIFIGTTTSGNTSSVFTITEHSRLPWLRHVNLKIHPTDIWLCTPKATIIPELLVIAPKWKQPKWLPTIEYIRFSMCIQQQKLRTSCSTR